MLTNEISLRPRAFNVAVTSLWSLLTARIISNLATIDLDINTFVVENKSSLYIILRSLFDDLFGTKIKGEKVKQSNN